MWDVNKVGCCRRPKVAARKLRGCEPTVTAYKVVHDNSDGTFTSCWAGGNQPYDTLDYLVDHVTTAPAGSQGIFTQESILNAEKQAFGELGHVEFPTAILEVICLGKKNQYGRYEQVLVTDIVEDSIEDYC